MGTAKRSEVRRATSAGQRVQGTAPESFVMGDLAVPVPSVPKRRGTTPCSITFFLTLQQRSQVIKRLEQVSPIRTRALLIALGVRRLKTRSGATLSDAITGGCHE